MARPAVAGHETGSCWSKSRQAAQLRWSRGRGRQHRATPHHGQHQPRLPAGGACGEAASGAVDARRPLWQPEQLVRGASDDAVALASNALEAGPVGDLDAAPLVADVARLL